jgi:site-specific DNA-methyltransferase (cytosine-N4-specific)
MSACKAIGVKRHPARFPSKLPEFFVRFLTDPGDLVLDIFAGSNTTGMVAEAERRRWLGFELEVEYVAASAFRFLGREIVDDDLAEIHHRILGGGSVDLAPFQPQTELAL